MDENRLIGKDNDLPWKRIPDDMKLFARKTTGNVVIMGRKTWESIPTKYRPLPDRENIVLSRDESFHDAPIISSGLENAIQLGLGFGKDVFIIGGAQIYAQALPLVDRLYISHIKGTFEGDTYFPEIDYSQFVELEDKRELYNDFTFKMYQRVK